MKISLCLLVYNEIGGCRLDVPLLPFAAFDDVYAVDGGSTDGTVEFLQSRGIPVYQQKQRGLNAAYHSAVEHSTGDAVVVFFPKGTISPLSLLEFRPLLENGNELVIASRNIPGACNEEDLGVLKPRKWGVTCLAALAALLWRTEGYVVRDILHGYKGFSVAAFNRIAPADYGLSIDLEMTVRAYRLKIPRIEFPVTETMRPFGQTRFKILPTGMKLLRYLWRELRR